MRLELSHEDLRPLVEAIVQEALGIADRLSPARIAYPEAEAAESLGIAKHQLRDARLRGEVSGAKVGKQILYERAELIRFIRQQSTKQHQTRHRAASA